MFHHVTSLPELDLTISIRTFHMFPDVMNFTDVIDKGGGGECLSWTFGTLPSVLVMGLHVLFVLIFLFEGFVTLIAHKYIFF